MEDGRTTTESRTRGRRLPSHMRDGNEPNQRRPTGTCQAAGSSDLHAMEFPKENSSGSGQDYEDEMPFEPKYLNVEDESDDEDGRCPAEES